MNIFDSENFIVWKNNINLILNGDILKLNI